MCLPALDGPEARSRDGSDVQSLRTQSDAVAVMVPLAAARASALMPQPGAGPRRTRRWSPSWPCISWRSWLSPWSAWAWPSCRWGAWAPGPIARARPMAPHHRQMASPRRRPPSRACPYRDDAVEPPAAGTTPDEPRSSCLTPSHTAWYALVPESDLPLSAWVVPDADEAATLDVGVAIFAQQADGSLLESGCVDDHGAGGPEQLVLTAHQGQAYYIGVSAVDRPEPGEGSLTFLAQRSSRSTTSSPSRAGSARRPSRMSLSTPWAPAPNRGRSPPAAPTPMPPRGTPSRRHRMPSCQPPSRRRRELRTPSTSRSRCIPATRSMRSWRSPAPMPAVSTAPSTWRCPSSAARSTGCRSERCCRRTPDPVSTRCPSTASRRSTCGRCRTRSWVPTLWRSAPRRARACPSRSRWPVRVVSPMACW